MKIRALIENTNHLSTEQLDQIQAAVYAIDNLCTICKSLDQYQGIFDHLKSLGWFVYRGGNHVAIHEGNGNPVRIAIVWESK
jgi:hypothetical protein